MLLHDTCTKTDFLNIGHKYIQHGFSVTLSQCFTADLCYYDQFKSAILYLSFVPDPFP